MGIAGVVGAVGVGLQVAGFAKQQSAMKQQANFNQQVLQDQQAQEAVRQQAVTLDAQRRRRSIVRQGIQAQAVATSRATNQGVADPGSSIVNGSMGTIAGQTDRNLQSINQSQLLSNDMFGLNADITQNKVGASRAGSSAAAGAGLMSLGGALIKDEAVFDRVGNYLFSPKKTTPYQGTSNPVNYGSGSMHSLY